MKKKYNSIVNNLGTGDAILVAQYFPPFNTIASQRALRMARVLLDNFKCVYVVTLPTVDLSEKYIDRDFGKEELSNPRLHIISISQLLDGYGIAAKPKLTHRIIGAVLTRVFCSHGSDWALALSFVLNRISGKDSLKLIVSTGGPFVPFWSVTNFANKANIPCILDYRDLWSQNPRAPYLWIFRYIVKITIERWVNSRCNVITTVSEGCRLSLKAEQPNLNIKTLLNTPDESYCIWFNKQSIEMVSRSFDPWCLNIVLTGTVYAECTCRVLVKAMALLPTNKRNRVRLNYFGASANLIKSDFINAAMDDNFVDFGYVKKSDAVSAVKSADILLSLVYDNGENQDSSAVLGLMTTKVFDYFLSGKPILNIGPESADVSRLAQECGYSEFHNFNFNQTRQLADFMEEALSDLHSFRQRVATARLPDFAKNFNNILNNAFFE